MQAELIQGACRRSAAPEGFDAARFQGGGPCACLKSSRAAARAWPGLAGALGDEWREQFRAFAENIPLPRDGGPLADGYAFARFLQRAGKLPDEGRLEALAVELRYRRCAGGLRPRRGIAVRVCLLGRPRRLILALRLPFLGERWLNLSYDRVTV
jgi:hypothetical protein